MLIVTSNPSKREEYQRFGIPNLQVIDGPDIREVNGTPDEIIIHKALEAGEGRIVEDAIIKLDGEPMVDVRWKIEALRKGEYPLGAEIIWEVRLGVVQGDVIKVYYGDITGELCACLEDGFGIDPVMYLPSEKLTLATMDRMGIKDRVSPRRIAIQKLIDDQPYMLVNKQDVQPWTGDYQHD
jgi:inosine/xanthosine triphosphate pyrophosphatase family protein